MIYVDSFQVQDIYVDSFHNPDIFIDSFRTFPNEVYTYAFATGDNTAGVSYSGGENDILADGSNYATFWGTLVKILNGQEVERRTVYLTPTFYEGNVPQDTSAWEIRGTRIYAEDRGTVTGGTRSVQVEGYYVINGEAVESPYRVTVYQHQNIIHYTAGEIEYIDFNDSRYSVNGSTLTLNNIGSGPASYNLSASGYRWYRYTSWGDSGWRKMTTLPTDVVVSGVKDGDNWVWNITEGSGFASLYNDGSSLSLNVERNQSTSNTRRISLTVEDPKYSDTRVTASTIQNADNYTFKWYDGTPNPYMVEYNDTTTYVYVVSKQGSSRSAIALENITISSNGARLTASTVTDYSSYSGEGVYRLTFAGATNSTTSERTSTIRVTQPDSGKYITLNIKQAIQGQFHNGMEIVSSYTLNNEVWDFGTVLLADGNRAMMIIKRNNTPVSADVKVNVNDVRWTTPVGTDGEYNTSFMIPSGSSISFPTYYEGNKTYYGAVFMNESEFYSMENLTVTTCDMSLEDGEAITNIHVEYWVGSSQSSNSYIPASGGDSAFAMVRGQKGNDTVVLDVAFASGTDTSIWTLDSQYMRIHAANRGTYTGDTRPATVNVSYKSKDYGTQTIIQQENRKSDTVSPGEIDWVRVNSDVIYSGDTVSIENFATTLQLTQVHGYRKQYYTSGAYDTVSMGYNDYTVSVEYGERSWINTGSTKNNIEVSANTSTTSSRDAVVTVADANGYNPNPSLSFTVEQAADTWVFSLYDSNTKSINYNETTFEINVYSKYNNSPYPIDTSLISFSSPNAVGITAGTVTLVNQNTGQYKISFTCGQNNGNGNLTTTITILQNSYTGAKMVSVTVTQYKQLTNEVKLNINGGVSTQAAKYKLIFDVMYNNASIYGLTQEAYEGNISTAVTFTLSQSPITVTYQGQMLTYANIADQTPSGSIPLTMQPSSVSISNGNEYTVYFYPSNGY